MGISVCPCSCIHVHTMLNGIYMYIWLLIHIYIYICVYMYICICICVCIKNKEGIHLYIYMYFSIYIYIYIYVYVYFDFCLWIYIYFCTHVCLVQPGSYIFETWQALQSCWMCVIAHAVYVACHHVCFSWKSVFWERALTSWLLLPSLRRCRCSLSCFFVVVSGSS